MTTRTRIQLGDGDPRHGTRNGYNNLGCRCDPCRLAVQTWRALTGPSLAADDPRHGTVNAYNNLGCRCKACTNAQRVYILRHQRRQAQARDELRMQEAGPLLARAEVLTQAGCSLNLLRRHGRLRWVRLADDYHYVEADVHAAIAARKAALAARSTSPAGMLSGGEVARLAGVTRQAVDQWATAGQLTKVRRGRQVYYAAAEVDALLASRNAVTS